MYSLENEADLHCESQNALWGMKNNPCTFLERLFTHAKAAEEVEDKGFVYSSCGVNRKRLIRAVQEWKKQQSLCHYVQRLKQQMRWSSEGDRGDVFLVPLCPSCLTRLIRLSSGKHVIKDIWGFTASLLMGWVDFFYSVIAECMTLLSLVRL